MRYNPNHKQDTFDKVIHETMMAIRENGPNIGIPKLMSKVGLTHGGFYAHFKSKEDLINQSIEKMFLDRKQMMLECLAEEDPVKGLESYIDIYLSEKHRKHPELGCPATTLISDMSRMSDSSKLVFESGMNSLIEELAKGIDKIFSTANSKEIAVTFFTEMIGSMSFARTIQDEAYANNILEITKKNLKAKIAQLKLQGS